MQKFIKYFYFSYSSVFGTFILGGNVVLLFRENLVCLLYLSLNVKTLRISQLFLLFMIGIPTFVLLFQTFEPYFIHTLSMEGT